MNAVPWFPQHNCSCLNSGRTDSRLHTDALTFPMEQSRFQQREWTLPVPGIQLFSQSTPALLFSFPGQSISSVNGSGCTGMARVQCLLGEKGRDAQNGRCSGRLPQPAEPEGAAMQPLHLVSQQSEPKYSGMLWSSTLNYPLLVVLRAALVLCPAASSKLIVTWSQTMKWIVLQLLITLQYLLLFRARNQSQCSCSAPMCTQI